jgi:hypothetical protein
MGELVFGTRVAEGDPALLDAYFEGLGLDRANTASLRANLPRLLVYRKLVRERLSEAIELAVPRTLARLGPLFDEYLARFLAELGPRSHYLRDVTNEWLDFCAPLWRSDPRVASYLHDLARHEALEIVIASGADAAPADSALELGLECSLRFIEAARVVRYTFAVHALPEDPADRSIPRTAPTALFVYRSPEHDVRYLELTPLAAGILERLLGGATLGEAVTLATHEAECPLDASVLDGTARLLADLAARGALLGAVALTREEPADPLPRALNPAEKGSTLTPPREQKEGP